MNSLWLFLFSTGKKSSVLIAAPCCENAYWFLPCPVTACGPVACSQTPQLTGAKLSHLESPVIFSRTLCSVLHLPANLLSGRAFIWGRRIALTHTYPHPSPASVGQPRFLRYRKPRRSPVGNILDEITPTIMQAFLLHPCVVITYFQLKWVRSSLSLSAVYEFYCDVTLNMHTGLRRNITHSN